MVRSLPNFPRFEHPNDIFVDLTIKMQKIKKHKHWFEQLSNIIDFTLYHSSQNGNNRATRSCSHLLVWRETRNDFGAYLQIDLKVEQDEQSTRIKIETTVENKSYFTKNLMPPSC